MQTVHKAFALLVRRGDAGPELLVFDHPHTLPQIPKGTVDPGEGFAAAALRELEEESGVAAVRIVRELPGCQRMLRGGPTGRNAGYPLENQRWHLFLMDPTAPLPDTWAFTPRGEMEEAEGLRFIFRWLPLRPDAAAALDPAFEPVVAILLQSLQPPNRTSLKP